MSWGGQNVFGKKYVSVHSVLDDWMAAYVDGRVCMQGWHRV